MQSRRETSKHYESNVWKGLAAGLVGGLVASWTMNQFQAMLSKLTVGVERSHGAQSMQQGSPQGSERQDQQTRNDDDDRDDATERLANAVSENVFDYQLTKSEKEVAGTAIHYGYGIATGAVYGAVAEVMPSVTAGAGVPFGAVVWLTADEGVVPMLGLSKSPTEYPLSIHAYALASHMVYGLTVELVRHAVRRAV